MSEDNKPEDNGALKSKEGKFTPTNGKKSFSPPPRPESLQKPKSDEQEKRQIPQPDAAVKLFDALQAAKRKQELPDASEFAPPPSFFSRIPALVWVLSSVAIFVFLFAWGILNYIERQAKLTPALIEAQKKIPQIESGITESENTGTVAPQTKRTEPRPTVSTRERVRERPNEPEFDEPQYDDSDETPVRKKRVKKRKRPDRNLLPSEDLIEEDFETDLVDPEDEQESDIEDEEEPETEKNIEDSEEIIEEY